MKVDLDRVAHLISELKAIDASLAGLERPHGASYTPSAEIVCRYLGDTNMGVHQNVSIPVEVAKEVLRTQGRAVVGLLRMHGLDIERK